MDYYVKSVIPIIESNYENFTALEKYCGFLYEKWRKMDFSTKRDRKTLVYQKLRYQDLQKCGFRGYREFIYQYEESFEEKNKTHGTYKNRVKYVPELLNKTYSLMDEAQNHKDLWEIRTGKESVRMWERKFRPCSERDASKIYENWSRYQFDSRSRSDENAGSIPKKGCLVIGISISGESEDVCYLLKESKTRADTILFTGKIRMTMRGYLWRISFDRIKKIFRSWKCYLHSFQSYYVRSYIFLLFRTR